MKRTTVKKMMVIGISLIVGTHLMPLTSEAATLYPTEITDGALSDSLKLMIFLSFLTLMPSIILTMTSFTRLSIVFSFLRSGLGTQNVPSNQILVGLTLFLTYFIMSPVLAEINEVALTPYLAGELSDTEVLEAAQGPLKTFMLSQTRQDDLDLFRTLSREVGVEQAEELSFTAIVPAFIISELKTAFEIGFLLFIPFMAIDFIVSSVLMSMGMFMLPPTMIALPFKLLLFIMVDGWHLLVESLVQGFY